MALNLTLDIEDSIKIGDNIEVKYLRKIGRKINISVEAPLSLKILRVKKKNAQNGTVIIVRKRSTDSKDPSSSSSL